MGVLACAAVALTCGRAPSTEKGKTSEAPASASAPAPDPKVENIVLARIGKRKITVHDLETKINVQFAQMMTGLEGAGRVRQQYDILKQMVNQYAWVDAGEKRGFDRDPDFRATLELSRKFILSNTTVKKLVYDKADPTEQEIRKYYEENPDQFHVVTRVQCSHILATTRAAAEAARRRALAGEDFGALATQLSTDPASRDVAGSLGTVTLRSDIRGFGAPSELNSKIMALRAGEVSEPIQTERGWSVFKVTERAEETTQGLDEVREAIRKKISTKRANELFSTTLADVKKETGAVIDEKAWQDYTFGVLNDDQIFEMAQGEKVPQERIKIYLELANRRPDGPRAAQALFMAGFTYADNLNDPGSAKGYFEKVLEKYPQCDLAASARWMLANMTQGLDNLPYAEQIRRKATGG